jgi:hypothetical protein
MGARERGHNPGAASLEICRATEEAGNHQYHRRKLWALHEGQRAMTAALKIAIPVVVIMFCGWFLIEFLRGRL